LQTTLITVHCSVKCVKKKKTETFGCQNVFYVINAKIHFLFMKKIQQKLQ